MVTVCSVGETPLENHFLLISLVSLMRQGAVCEYAVSGNWHGSQAKHSLTCIVMAHLCNGAQCIHLTPVTAKQRKETWSTRGKFNQQLSTERVRFEVRIDAMAALDGSRDATLAVKWTIFP